MEIINVFENEKLSAREIVKRFNIGKTQAAEINKNKATIRSRWESGVNVHQKRSFLKEAGSEIDKMCFDWFAKARIQKIPLSGPIVKAKAIEIAIKLGISNFNASNGWLNRWRLRNNVAFKCISAYLVNLQILLRKINTTRSALELAKSINVLEAVYFLKTSWDKVKTTTIQNGFCKAGFSKDDESFSDFDPEDDIPLALYAKFQEGPDLANDFDDFLKIDRNVCTEDDNIEIEFEEHNDKMDISDSEEEPNEEISEPITSYDEALTLVARLKQFAKNDFVAFQHIKNIESHFENEHFKLKQSMLKQSIITKFFQPK
ncbi:uncharacterized protein LOC119666109 [Teleopsis dalmanni]|uniref:uncharacterized protein LOC119666109 n=1 Tax=Teleopsis dalmanni TaxID=139649 RepID=UPI0018CFD523|nr:uncharacterized protein LOC119666109 [Teleopsis dalmanni]